VKLDISNLDTSLKSRKVSWRLVASPWLSEAAVHEATINVDFVPDIKNHGRFQSSELDEADSIFIDIYLDRPVVLQNSFFDIAANALFMSKDAILYSDYFESNLNGTSTHVRLPKFSFERFLANDYLGPVIAIASVEKPSDQPLSRTELLLNNELNILRIPKPTYETNSSEPSTKLKNEHLNKVSYFVGQNRGAATCNPNFEDGSLDISYAPMATGTVSIVIPTRGSSLEEAPLSMVENCVKSTLMQDRSGIGLEIVLVVDTDTDLEYVSRISQSIPSDVVLKVVNFDPPFNFSKKCNDGFAVASGETIVFLNDDTEWMGGEGLKELVATANLPNVGVVGALLFYEDGFIQHAGQIMVPPNIFHAYRYQKPFQGPEGDMTFLHEASGVTGACMALKREVIDKISGWSEHFPNSFNDVDLCFKVRELNFSVLQANRVHLYHYESKTRSPEVYTSHHQDLQKRWKQFLDHEDYMRSDFALGKSHVEINDVGKDKADMSGHYVKYFFYVLRKYGLKGILQSARGVLHKTTRPRDTNNQSVNL
jgi:GT2 family glycosyltransferase